MNVAIFTESLGCGGISSYCLELASELQGMPDVRVFLVGINDNRWCWVIDEARLRGLTIHEVQVAGRFDWKGIRKIHSFVTENEIDIVHTQGYRLNVLVRLSRLMYRTRVKLVNTVHGVYAFRSSRWLTRIYYLLDYITFSLSDKTIAVSATTAKQLVAWHVPRARKAVVIPNGVRQPSMANDDTLTKLRSELGIASLERTVGFVGRLSAEKGAAWLCEIIQGLIKQDSTYQALIVGNGPLRYMIESLRDAWPMNVIYVGEQHDVHPYFQLMGALVVPSQTEGMPMVVIEAFLHGVPVIASNVGGMPEIVSDGSTGFLCKYGDSGAMIDRVTGLLSNDAMRARISANCLAHYSENHSCRLMAERTLKLYRETMGVAG